MEQQFIFTIVISLNKNLNELNTFIDEKSNRLIKMHNELCLIIIDEILLVKNKIIAFIDCRLCVIKQIHKQQMGGLDVIMTTYFFIKLLLLNAHGFQT